MTENPYEAPQIFDAPNVPSSDAEAVRRYHLKTEASIKSIGILYYLGGIVSLLVSVSSIVNTGSQKSETPLLTYGIAIGLFLLAIFQFFAGAAVRKFKPWSRIAVGILSGIGLLKLPVGTLISAYILFTVFGKKGQMVFSEPYQNIIAATPHVKYKTSKAVWIMLGIVIAIIVLLLSGVFFGNRH